jgi:hypothetical protein
MHRVKGQELLAPHVCNPGSAPAPATDAQVSFATAGIIKEAQLDVAQLHGSWQQAEAMSSEKTVNRATQHQLPPITHLVSCQSC